MDGVGLGELVQSALEKKAVLAEQEAAEAAVVLAATEQVEGLGT